MSGNMKLTRRHIIWSSIIGAVSLLGFDIANLFKGKNMKAYAAPSAPSDKPFVPGTKETIPRVVSVHSPKASVWNGAYPYVDSIDEAVVKTMLDKGLMQLTSEKTPADAWHTLFSPYVKGDIVAIKPNFNDLFKEFRENLVTSPAVINAILAGLVDTLGIPPADIVIYDCTREIPDAYRDRIHYPVQYVESYGSSFARKVRYKLAGNPLPKADRQAEIEMTSAVKDKAGNPIQCYLPKVITQAQHIINVPILKSHQFVLASGALKNHYGTVRFSDGITGPLYLHPPIIHESIADVNAHPQIREKTRLVVMDAIFGRLKKKGGAPDTWIQFDGNNPQRLFLSQDPVALDSTTSHLIKTELVKRHEEYHENEYLKIAAQRGLGTFEEPNEQNSFRNIEYNEVEI